MLTVEQVKNNILDYKITNGIVIEKSSNQPVQDEDKILEVKSSFMMYREAKGLYDDRRRGMPENQDYYIKRSLNIYGLDGDINTYPQNKIIREIIESNGSVQVDYGGNDLLVSEKFSFMCGQKKDYGLSIIKYMAHQKGIDISNLDVSIDLSDFQKNGVSKVNIKYNKGVYQRKEPTPVIETPNVESQVQSTQQTLYQHSMLSELNELERKKQIAKQNNDEDAFYYWDANLRNLEEKKYQTSIVDNKSPEKHIEHKSDSLDFSVMINQLRTQNSQISSEYKAMLSDGYIDDEELAILISRLKDLSDNALVIKSMVTDEKQEMMIDSIIEMINQECVKMTRMKTGIEETKHSFGR